MEKNDPIIEEIFADLNFVIQNKIIALFTSSEIIEGGKILKDGERYENYEER